MFNVTVVLVPGRPNTCIHVSYRLDEHQTKHVRYPAATALVCYLVYCPYLAATALLFYFAATALVLKSLLISQFIVC